MSGFTSLLMTVGAPLRNSSAEPLEASLDSATTPERNVYELNSSTFTIVSSAVLKLDRFCRCFGRTTLALSCNTLPDGVTVFM